LQSTSQANAILTASGYVVAQRKAAVASKGMGRLLYLGVVEGDRVNKDQVIARLESQDVQAQLDEVKANLKVQEAELKVAGNNFQRQKSLFKQQLASELDVDNAESNYDRVLALIELAKARIRAAEVAVENTVIRAPFAGTVLTKNADVGEIVAPLAAGVNSRAAVVTIADMTSLQVETDVSESNIQKISTGLECEIALDAYPSERYAGYVDKIVPTADRAKATVLVKVAFKEYDQQVLPEMSAKVYFIGKSGQPAEDASATGLVIPQTALATRNGKSVVFKVQDEAAVPIEVTTGQKFGALISINSGLTDGDRIINPVDNQIKDGTAVVVK
jgi:RND family efflux transporter MFP subunit